MMNPTLYPSLDTSGVHFASGRWWRSSPSAAIENPIDSPAASPDQNSAAEVRPSSSSASFRIDL